MAKIEITGSPEELDRISTFLQNNNLRFSIVKDYGNHAAEELKKYQKLINKFN